MDAGPRSPSSCSRPCAPKSTRRSARPSLGGLAAGVERAKSPPIGDSALSAQLIARWAPSPSRSCARRGGCAGRSGSSDGPGGARRGDAGRRRGARSIAPERGARGCDRRDRPGPPRRGGRRACRAACRERAVRAPGASGACSGRPRPSFARQPAGGALSRSRPAGAGRRARACCSADRRFTAI